MLQGKSDMNFRILHIKPALRHCVSLMIQIEYKSENVVYRNFPTSSLSLTFNYGAKAQERTIENTEYTPNISLGGFQTNPIEYIPEGKTGLIIVKLKPFAKALLKDLNGQFTLYGNWDLSDIYHKYSNSLYQHLIEINDPNQRVTMVENYLEKIFGNKTPNPYALAAIEFYNQYKGRITVKNMAEKLGYSKKQFERFFVQTVGITPKKYARLIRFQESMQLISTGSQSLTQVALTAGYFDQAHFNKEFKQFTGGSPEAFIALSTELTKNAIPSQLERCQSNLTLHQ